MHLELIIQEVKVIEMINDSKDKLFPQSRQSQSKTQKNIRFYRMQLGTIINSSEIQFLQPCTFHYDGSQHLLSVEIFQHHKYLNNADLTTVLCANIDMSNFSNLKGNYIQCYLKNYEQKNQAKLILTIQVFKKGKNCMEKVMCDILFKAAKQQKERLMKVSEASKNIKNLLVNSALTDWLMTINSLHLIPEKQDTDILNHDCLVLVRQGILSKAYSSITRITSSDSISWMNYIKFMKNQDIKFQFFFIYFDQRNSPICKAKGEIKYIVFDETINCHSIPMFDKKSNKYGILMVKFIDKQEQAADLENKTEKKIRQVQQNINESINNFNKYKFQVKYNNHVLLSQKLIQQEQQKLQEEQNKQRPLNSRQKKQKQQHGKFIQFLQKQVIKIEKELKKRQDHDKSNQRRNRYAPMVSKDKKVIK